MRDFICENAFYWLEEFALDGLRFDAVDRIEDEESDIHFVEELAPRIREALPGRHVHLVVEDSRGITRLHERAEDNSVRLYDGVWNDGYHHLIHAWATGEHCGHFKVFADDFWPRIGKTLATGFALQGEQIEGGAMSSSVSPAATCLLLLSSTFSRTTTRSATAVAVIAFGA